MLALNHHRIFSYYHEALQIKSGQFPIPRMILLLPALSCNANCEYCPYKKENKSGIIMTEAQAYRVIDEVAGFGLKAITLCGGGEPLVPKYIDKLFFHIKNKGLKFGVLTNGINLSGDIMKNIINWGSYIRISYDSVVKDVYKKCKGVDKAEVVFDNIIQAIKYKQETKSNCDISVKIGLNLDNCDTPSLTKTIHALKKLSLDSIQVRLLRKINNPVPQDILQNIFNIVSMYDESLPPANLSISFDKTAIDKKCWLTPIHSVVSADGKVYLCCYFANRPDKHCIGNIFEKPFDEIWGSPEHEKAIQEIKFEECNIYDCRFHTHTKVMEEGLEKGSFEFF